MFKDGRRRHSLCSRKREAEPRCCVPAHAPVPPCGCSPSLRPIVLCPGGTREQIYTPELQDAFMFSLSRTLIRTKMTDPGPDHKAGLWSRTMASPHVVLPCPRSEASCSVTLNAPRHPAGRQKVVLAGRGRGFIEASSWSLMSPHLNKQMRRDCDSPVPPPSPSPAEKANRGQSRPPDGLFQEKHTSRGEASRLPKQEEHLHMRVSAEPRGRLGTRTCRTWSWVC